MSKQVQLTPWWEDEKNSHSGIQAILENLQYSQSVRSAANLRYARLYGNLDIYGLAPYQYFRTVSQTSDALRGGSRLTFNVIKSVVDTVGSKIAKHKPRPLFLTNDGDWSLQQRAKRLNRFVQGVFYETDAYGKGQTAFRDAGIFGTGILKVYIKDARLCIERIIPEELIVDASESVYGKPRSYYQVKHVDRQVLLRMFPDHEGAIRSVRNTSEQGAESQLTSDMIKVTEAWHLPSDKKAKDGRHVIAIENDTLFSEEYKREVPPFIIYHWTPPVLGFYGTGLAEELIGIQLEINKLLRQIQLSHHLLSTPKVLLENGSKIVSAHINNEIGAIIKYTGTPPQIVAFQTVHPEIYLHLERLYARAYEIAGVSALSAQAKKPSGLDSGRALREFSDIESERFAIQQQRYEEFYMELSRHIIELSREIVKEHGGFRVKAPNKKLIDEIDFKEVSLEDSSYILQCFPTNFLPATPAGRLQSVQELMTAGLISPSMGLALLDFPDLEGAMSLANANYNIVMSSLENIIEKGVYEAPEPYMDLLTTKMLSQMFYLDAKSNKVDEDKLELLRRYVDATVALINKATPPTPVGAPAMPAMPTGGPSDVG